LLRARGLATRADAEGVLLYVELGEAELELARGRTGAARSIATHVVQKARASGASYAEIEALVFLAGLELGARNVRAAKSVIETTIARAEEIGANHERGQALLYQVELRLVTGEESEGQRPLVEILDEVAALFSDMGAEADLAKARKLRARVVRRARRPCIRSG
jgi:hypothetical protein